MGGSDNNRQQLDDDNLARSYRACARIRNSAASVPIPIYKVPKVPSAYLPTCIYLPMYMTDVCTGAMARTVIIDEPRKYTKGIALSELNSMISSAYINKPKVLS
jgi:hypothetical protein